MQPAQRSDIPATIVSGRRTTRRLDERLRRDRRALAAELQERAEREALPRDDVGPPPRVD